MVNDIAQDGERATISVLSNLDVSDKENCLVILRELELAEEE